jgi:phenylpropionate dioxygenase-like ring-hydroxylating dioxygenase large terminal subunit
VTNATHVEKLHDRLRATVRPEEGAIPLFVYSDPDVYRLELERVFGRVWLFVAHESELEEEGAFVVRQMGEQSVIVARGDDGEIRVFLNACRHRGMRLTCEDRGVASMWRCPYHGFTFANYGNFMGTPFERAAYPPNGLDRERLRLIEARCDSYAGMIFATWDKEGESLPDFLGDLRWYLDIFAGRAQMELVGEAQRWVIPSSWKLPSENFASDAYHTATAHAFLARLGLVRGVDFGRDGYHVDAGRGHGLGMGVHDDRPGSWFPPELEPEYASKLDADQLALLHRVKNFHGNVFPNMSFLIPNFIPIDGRLVTGMMLRMWQPVGPDRLVAWSWFLVEKNAPAWWKEKGRRMYTQTFSSSGMFDQDDTENWEAQTEVANASLTRPDEVMLDYTMGLDATPLSDFPGPGTVYDGKFSESAARTFYRTWLDLLTEEAR